MSTFKQYILPQIPCNVDGVLGVWDTRISRGLCDFNHIDFAPAEVLTLDSNLHLAFKWSPKKSAQSDQTGQMTVDGRTLTISDLSTYSGVSNGAPFTESLVQKSLLWKIFESNYLANDTVGTAISVYQVWRTFMPATTKGAYNAGTTYALNNTVSFNGMPYKALGPTTGNSPKTTGTYGQNYANAFWKPNWDISFGGDVDQTQLAKAMLALHLPRTSGQIEFNQVTLKINPFLDRAKNANVGMLTGVNNPYFAAETHAPTGVPFVQSDMYQFPANAPGAGAGGGSVGWTITTRPFYMGLIPKSGGNGRKYRAPNTYATWTNASIDATYATEILDIAAYMRYDAWDEPSFADAGGANYNAFPFHMWGVRPSKCIAKGANLIQADFDPTNDFTSAFTFKSQSYDGANNKYVQADIASLDSLAVCYNVLFGINPGQSILGSSGRYLTPKSYTNPVSFDPNTTIAEYWQTWAYQFGCYIWAGYNQLTGHSRVRFLSRRTSFASDAYGWLQVVPATWGVKSGYPKREQTQISKKCIQVTNRGRDGKLQCPLIPDGQNADSIDIEMRFAVRRAGHADSGVTTSSGCLNDTDVTLNSKKDMNNQDPMCRVLELGDQSSGVNANGWWIGSHLFYIHDSTQNNFFPSTFVNQNCFNNAAANQAWEGFYAVAACYENSGLSADTIALSRGDTLTACGQVLAQELLVTKVMYSVGYNGCSDGAGKLSVIKPNIEDTIWPVGGASTTLRFIDLEIDEDNGTTIAKGFVKPAYNSLTPLWSGFIGDASASASGGSSTSNNVPADVLTGTAYVQTGPNASGVNRIVPTTTGTDALTLKQFTASTANLITGRNIADSATVFSVDYAGNITGVAGSLTGALNMNSHLINNVLDPVSAQDAATKHYTDAAVAGITLTGYALLAPASVQTFQPTGTTISGFDVQGKNGQTGNIVNIRNYAVSGTGTLTSYFDKFGAFGTNAGIKIDEASALIISGKSSGTTRFTVDSSGSTAITTASDVNGLKITMTGLTSADAFNLSINGSNGLTLNYQSYLLIGTGTNVGTAALKVSGSIGTDTRTLTGATTLDETYSNVVLDAGGGAFTTTLPTVSGCKGREYNLVRKNAGVNNTTIAAHAGDTIGYPGVASLTPSVGQSFILVSDGGTHWIIG